MRTGGLLLVAVAILITVGGLLAGVADAGENDTYPLETPPTAAVEGIQLEPAQPAVQPAQADPAPTQTLPITGADVLGLVVLGVALVGAGFLVLRLRPSEA